MNHIVDILKSGGVIAYPTEAVYGLGCDPFNESAVMRLLEIKQRSVDKGVILAAANWQQVEDLVTPLSEQQLHQIQAVWPGHVTWLLPASNKVPSWIKGKHREVAIRVSAHPVVQALCLAFNGPIVSTSANLAGQEAIRECAELQSFFHDQVDAIVTGDLGGETNPSEIRQLSTGKVLR